LEHGNVRQKLHFRLLAPNDVLLAEIRRHFGCRHVAEERLQVLDPSILKVLDQGMLAIVLNAINAR
jgi:hypothetical protein